MHELELHVGEPNLIEWEGMLNQATGAYINDATVTFVLKDTAGAVVTDGGGALAYVAGSNGDYRGTMSSAAAIVRGREYLLEMTSDASPAGFRRIKCLAVYHGAQ